MSNPAILKNGRCNVLDFGNSFSKSLTVKVVTSSAFISLTSAEKSVLFMMFIKNDNAKFHRQKDGDGRPVFEYPVLKAQKDLQISNRTFLTAVRHLITCGFIEHAKQDNPTLKSMLGARSLYRIGKAWRDWKPAKISAKQRLAELEEQSLEDTQEAIGLMEKITKRKNVGLVNLKAKDVSSTKPVKQSSPVFEPGQRVYFYKPDGIRAVLGNLVSQSKYGWRVMGLRTAKEFNPPTYEIPTSKIQTVEEVKKRNGGRRRKSTEQHHSKIKPSESPFTRTSEKTWVEACAE